MLSGVLQGLSSLEHTPGEAWLHGVVLAAAPAIATMSARRLSKVYGAATNLEPGLALAWGSNFQALLGAQAHAAQGRAPPRAQPQQGQVQGGVQPPRPALTAEEGNGEAASCGAQPCMRA